MEPVRGLGDAVSLTRVTQELDGPSQLLQKPVVLIGLWDRHPLIILAVRDEERRVDAVGVLDRRPALVRRFRLRRQATEAELEQVRDVGLTEERIPVGDAGVTDRGLEAVRLGDGPERHEATVATAHYGHALGVGDTALDHVIDALHQVLEVFAAPVELVRIAELERAAGAAARIALQHRVTTRGPDLRALVEARGEA